MNPKTFFFILASAFVLPITVLISYPTYKSYSFKNDCLKHFNEDIFPNYCTMLSLEHSSNIKFNKELFCKTCAEKSIRVPFIGEASKFNEKGMKCIKEHDNFERCESKSKVCYKSSLTQKVICNPK